MFRILTNPCLKFESFASVGLHKKILKFFGRALGRPAPPRPASPTSFVFARNQQGVETQIKGEARDKGAGTQRAEGRPSGPMQAGRPLPSTHVPSPPTRIHPPASQWSRASTWSNGHCSGCRPACPSPAGLASARGYKSQPGRRSSMHQKLRCSCPSPCSLIPSLFLELLA